MESIMATGTVSGELLGDLSEELRAQMADSPVGLFTLYQALTARRDELRRDAAATDWATKAACRHRRHLRPSRSVA
jgi:hypothetical protein